MSKSNGLTPRKNMYGSTGLPAVSGSTSGSSQASSLGPNLGTVAGLRSLLGELHRLDNTMPVSQALILFYVAGRISNPPSLREVASALELQESRVSRNCALLEDMGVIGKHRDPLDVRTKFVSLTPLGEAFVAKLCGLIIV